MALRKYLENEAATFAFGASFLDIVNKDDVIALYGNLGAGKSVFARGLINHALIAGGHGEQDIPSPTFTLVQTYPWGADEIWHFDLWRIEHPDEVLELGFFDALGKCLMLIEWAERLGDALPKEALSLYLTPHGEGRMISTSSPLESAWESRLAPLFDI